MENFNAPNKGMATSASTALIEEPKVDKLRDINAALVGKLRVLKPLGGSKDYDLFLARVYTQQTVDPEAGDLIRLKVLSKAASLNPRKIELFYLEGFAASRLTHSNITRTTEPEYFGGMHMCAAAHDAGFMSLRSLIDLRAWLAPEIAASIACQIAEALSYAHALGVLHLNLHPESILVGADGRVLVTDFGIRANPDFVWARKERSRRLAAQYLSPEQAQEIDTDHRSDLYSLGILLYEMLTDRLPFDSDDPDVIKRKHISHAPQAPQVFRAGLSALQSGLVMSLLEKSPDKRCQNTAQLRSVLASLAGDSNNGPNHLSVPATGEGDVRSAAPAESDSQLEDETTGDNPLPGELTALPQIDSTIAYGPPLDLVRDPFYEEEDGLPGPHLLDEPEGAGRSSPAPLNEQHPASSLVSAESETTTDRLDDLIPLEPKPDSTTRLEFEPPTITVIDPPLAASAFAGAVRVQAADLYHKDDGRALQGMARLGGSRWRWGILILFVTAIAVFAAIYLAKGNGPSSQSSNPADASAAIAPPDASGNSVTGTPPEKGEAENKEPDRDSDKSEADVKEAAQVPGQENQGLSENWRTQSVTRSQGLRTRRPVIRAQARKSYQQSKRKYRRPSARFSRRYRRY